MINKDSIIIGITETKTSFIGDEAYKYMYRSDNIGNRVSANENGVNKSYTVNDLNQYTANSVDTGFTPTYDADGNQTRIKTSAGIFTVEYNAENRPIQFKSSMGRIYNMSYDYMGRRFYMSSYFQGMHDGDSTELFYYNGYTLIESQQILSGPNAMRFTQSYIWDPTSGQATRPLAMFNSNSKTLRDANLSDTRFDVMFDNTQNIHYYTHDANKNVTELISDSGDISAHYEYSPFGATIASSGDLSYSNPFQFSSEFFDSELGLTYYNYRHYNPLDGRWISRDPIAEQGGYNLYAMVENKVIFSIDYIGLKDYTSKCPKISISVTHKKKVFNEELNKVITENVIYATANDVPAYGAAETSSICLGFVKFVTVTCYYEAFFPDASWAENYWPIPLIVVWNEYQNLENYIRAPRTQEITVTECCCPF